MLPHLSHLSRLIKSNIKSSFFISSFFYDGGDIQKPMKNQDYQYSSSPTYSLQKGWGKKNTYTTIDKLNKRCNLII